MNFDIQKLAALIEKDGPSLGVLSGADRKEVGVLWFAPGDLPAVEKLAKALIDAHARKA